MVSWRTDGGVPEPVRIPRAVASGASSPRILNNALRIARLATLTSHPVAIPQATGRPPVAQRPIARKSASSFFTASQDLSKAAFSSAVNSTSSTRSAPPAPITTGTPT